MSKSIFHGSGYWMNDDRLSGGKLEEGDTLSCAHCDAGLIKQQWRLQGGMCMVCAQPLCFKCYDRAKKFGCEGPMVKRIEQEVDDLYRKAQNAKILGL